MQSIAKILLVEDDESLGFVIKDNLEQAAYDVIWCKDGLSGWESCQSTHFDLCIFDVMLPKMDGFSLVQEMRIKDTQTPVIMLTAKSMKEDVLAGFKYGADDYVIKPFEMEELLLRMSVFLRRSKRIVETEPTSYEIGHFKFDIDNFRLVSDELEYSLTEREALLLQLFCKQINKVVKREYILEEIWGENDYFLGRSLDVFISRLRKYLRSDDSIEIINHHGVGFKLSVNR
jgi:DNA-binding response OmpR family regulator